MARQEAADMAINRSATTYTGFRYHITGIPDA